MAITLATLRADVAFRFRDKDNNFLPSDNVRLDGWANEVQQEIARRSLCFIENSGFRITKGQPFIVLPADFIALTQEPVYQSAYTIPTRGERRWLAFPDRASGFTTGTSPLSAILRHGRVNAVSQFRLWLWPVPSVDSNKTTLNGLIGASDTSIVVTDATQLPSAGRAIIEDATNGNEEVYYSSVSGNTLQNVVRGIGGTTGVAHASLLNIFRADVVLAYARRPVTITATVNPELADDDISVVINGILAIAFEADRQMGQAAHHRALYERGVQQMRKKYNNANESQDAQLGTSNEYAWTFGNTEEFWSW